MRVRWDVWIMILSIYTSFLIPYEVAFLETKEGYKKGNEWLNYIFDIFFISDIILNFFTTTMDPYTGLELDDKCEIATHYLQG